MFKEKKVEIQIIVIEDNYLDQNKEAIQEMKLIIYSLMYKFIQMYDLIFKLISHNNVPLFLNSVDDRSNLN